VRSKPTRFLAVSFPDTQVQILPYNRTVRDLAGQTAAAFLAQVRRRFRVVEGPAAPQRKGQVGMFLDGQWYTVDLAGATPEDNTRASGLDVALLQRNILERC
jgi:uncharacterized protein (DUF1015 family)